MIQFPTTQLSLLAKIHDLQNHEAWSDFLAIYRSVIYRFGRSRGLQEADALDLVQSVFAAVAEKIGAWKPDPQRAKFRSWLARIATYQIVTQYRQRHKSARGSDGSSVWDELPQPGADTVELRRQYQRALFRRAARQAREEFSETTWQAFWLTSVEEQPIAEVAATLHRSVGSIYTARSRVIRRLTQIVQALNDQDLSLTPELLLGENPP